METASGDDNTENTVIGVGMNVEACFGAVTSDSAHKRWFDGKVQSMNVDGTYNIRFKGGLRQDSVAKHYVRPAKSNSSRNAASSSSSSSSSSASSAASQQALSQTTPAPRTRSDTVEAEEVEETPAEVAELLHLLRAHGSKPTTVEDIKSMPDAIAEISNLRKLVRHVYMELQCKTLKLVPSPAHGHNRSSSVSTQRRAWSSSESGTATKSRSRARKMSLQFPLKSSASQAQEPATPVGNISADALSKSMPMRGYSTPAVLSRSSSKKPASASKASLTIKAPGSKGPVTPQLGSAGRSPGDTTPGIANALSAFQATMRKKSEFTTEEAGVAVSNIANSLQILASVDPEMWSKQFAAIDELRAIIIHRPKALDITWADALRSGDTASLDNSDNADTPSLSRSRSEDDFLVEDETLLDEPSANAFSPPSDQLLVERLCALIRRLAVNLRTSLARNGLACIANLFEFTSEAMTGEIAETIPFLVKLAGTTDKKFIRGCAREAIKQAIKSPAKLSEQVAAACLDPEVANSKSASVVNEAASWFQAAVDEGHSSKALSQWQAKELCAGITRLFNGRGSKARTTVRSVSQKFQSIHGNSYGEWLAGAGMAKHDIAKMVAKPKSRASARDKLKEWKRQQKKAAAAAAGSAPDPLGSVEVVVKAPISSHDPIPQ